MMTPNSSASPRAGLKTAANGVRSLWMIAATEVYNSMPIISPEEAADMVAEAVIKKPKRIATRLGISLQVMNALMPHVTEVLMNTVFRMFGDSAAARGEKKPEEVRVSNEQVALAALMKGVHF